MRCIANPYLQNKNDKLNAPAKQFRGAIEQIQIRQLNNPKLRPAEIAEFLPLNKIQTKHFCRIYSTAISKDNRLLTRHKKRR